MDLTRVNVEVALLKIQTNVKISMSVHFLPILVIGKYTYAEILSEHLLVSVFWVMKTKFWFREFRKIMITGLLAFFR